MRRLAFSTLALAALVAAPSSAEAQVRFGGTVAYHLDLEALGVGAVVKAPLPALHENVGIMGDFTWYFPDGFDYFEVNGNLTYDFLMEDSSITPFALGGLVIARTSFDSEEVFGVDIGGSSTDVGLNLGGGIAFEGSLSPMVGAKLEIQDGSGFVIFGSVLLGGS